MQTVSSSSILSSATFVPTSLPRVGYHINLKPAFFGNRQQSLTSLRSKHQVKQIVTKASLGLSPTAVKWVTRALVAALLVPVVMAAQKLILKKEGESLDVQGWFNGLFSKSKQAKLEKDLIKMAGNWHSSTKGTLVRKFRVPTLKEGKKLLNEISGLLSDDDMFRDAASHKGCRVRRESAHSESVCCNNVRVLLEELPTVHLKLEITVFPPGPLTSVEYQRAGKLEQVLRHGHSI